VKWIRVSAILGFCALVGGGCGSDLTIGQPLGPESVKNDPVDSSVPSPSVDFSGPQPLDAFDGELVGEIEAARNRLVASCMADAGFPQLANAGVGTSVRNPFFALRIREGLFGPDTQEQAVRYGYLPFWLWEAEPELPKVVSSEPGFNAAYDVCLAGIAEVIAAVGGDALDRYWDIGNRITWEFRESIGVLPDAEPIFDDWLACMSTEGYVGGSVGAYLSVAYPPAFFGIQTGSWEQVVAPESPALRADEIALLEPGDHGTYLVSAGEQELGLADVRCKIEVGFWPRIFPLLIANQGAILADYQADLAELTPKVEGIARELLRLEESA